MTLEEYLHTDYSPDCDFVDGVVEERSVGLRRHSRAQSAVLVHLFDMVPKTQGRVLVELRIQVSSTRVRIPDVCVVLSSEEVPTVAPLLCVEIMSPEDRWSRVQPRITDYHAMGVPCVWVIDPYSSRVWIFDLDQPPREVQDGMLRRS